MNFLTSFVVPPFAKWLAIAVVGGFLFLFGMMHGERIAGERHIDYVNKQASESTRIILAQEKVVIKTEVEYRDRIQKIYIKGDVIEKEVPVYVTQADNAGCTINAGFVRIHDAAWTGDIAGPAAGSDREPSGISLSEVGEANAHNAKACRAWREQAIGLRKFYEELKLATNSPSK